MSYLFDSTTNENLQVNCKFNADTAKLLLANFDEVSRFADLNNDGKISAHKTVNKKALQWIVEHTTDDSYASVKLHVKNKYGRFYPKNGYKQYLGIHRPIRHALAHGLYRDIDMDNCHPKIIEQLYHKLLGKPASCLRRYNEIRSTILETMQSYGLTRDDGKTLSYTFLYDGKVDYWFEQRTHLWNALLNRDPKITEIYNMAGKVYKECVEMRSFIASNFQEMWNELPYNNDKPKDRHPSGKFSTLIQHIERQFIQHIYQTFSSKIEIGDLQHDGLYIAKDTPDFDSLLSKFEQKLLATSLVTK